MVEMTQDKKTAIDTIVDDLLAVGAEPGLSMLITGPAGDYTLAKGYGDPGWEVLLKTTDKWRAGSCTKSLTATVILKLIAAGGLSLTSTVGQFVNGIPGGAQITVEHLLTQRSGLVDYSNNTGLKTRFFTNPRGDFPIADILNAIRSSTPAFAPGTNYLYSNSNYVLLGQIIKVLTGKNYRVAIKDDILTPLGMTNSKFPTSYEMPTPCAYGYGYNWLIPSFTDEYTELNPEFFGAAGALVTTLGDFNKYIVALRDGTLLDATAQALRDEIAYPVPYTDAGPSHFNYGIGEIWFGKWRGINGSLPGYGSCGFYHPETGATIIGMENFQNRKLEVFTYAFQQVAEELYPGSTLTTPTI